MEIMEKGNKILKDEDITYYRIKIRRIRERKGTRNDMEYKDKLWCVDSKDYSGRGVGFCEPTLKKAFKKLMELLYL